jgi:ATP synthase protein I
MTRQGDDGSFEQRLASARSRQGLDPTDQAASSTANSAWGVGARVGVELVAALAVGVAIGWGLDRWLHTLPLFLVIFVLLGGAAGIMNVWRMLAPRKS